MAGKKPTAGDLDDVTVARIRQSIVDQRGKSMFEGAEGRSGPMCRCGLYRKPAGLAKHVVDDGSCPTHPGVVQRGWNETSSG